jgi:hypothetical protein
VVATERKRFWRKNDPVAAADAPADPGVVAEPAGSVEEATQLIAAPPVTDETQPIKAEDLR